MRAIPKRRQFLKKAPISNARNFADSRLRDGGDELLKMFQEFLAAIQMKRAGSRIEPPREKN
jgi:hypothetical protein